MIVPVEAMADALRCGDRLVHLEAAAGEVLQTCGEPDSRLQRVVTRADLNLVDEEDWTYDFGRDRFITTLVFRDGRLFAIEKGGYGTGRSAGGAAPAP